MDDNLEILRNLAKLDTRPNKPLARMEVMADLPGVTFYFGASLLDMSITLHADGTWTHVLCTDA